MIFRDILLFSMVVYMIQGVTVTNPLPNTCSGLNSQPSSPSDCLATIMTNGQTCCYVSVLFQKTKISACIASAGLDQASIAQAKDSISTMGADATLDCGNNPPATMITNTCSTIGNISPATPYQCTSAKLSNGQVCCYVSVTSLGNNVSACVTAMGSDQGSINRALSAFNAMGSDATIACASTFLSISFVTFILSLIIF
jgi:hypothetical protein